MTLGIAKPEQYESQLRKKIEETQLEFSEFYNEKIEVFPSETKHFRMRAEFKIWQQDDTAYYAMYKQGEYKKPVIIDAFTIGSKTISRLMPPLLQEVNKSETLRKKLFQVEFLTTLQGESVTTLIYHKPLDNQWETEASALQKVLDTKIIGRSKKQKIVLDQDYVTESFNVLGVEYKYQQVETGFTQPNGRMCENMLNWACSSVTHIGGDLLELYCGNGNFTLPLSKHFTKVLATEVSKTSVNSAKFNISNNKITNIAIARMSSEEFTQALNKEREFRRLKEINVSQYDFSTIFVDPPRAGLDTETEKLCTKFDNILYVSCNPVTLKENLKTLCKSHKIEKFALFDQFPYTEHRECGVLLKRI